MRKTKVSINSKSKYCKFLRPEKMKRKNSFTYLVALLVGLTMFVSCGQAPQSSDIVQKEQQEKILAEGSAQVGMPAIKNFRERKIVKDLYELRDQNGLVTYTYIFSEYTGKYTYLGETIGYGIPYATQFT
ncbi:MAG: hypothetical protein NT165_02690, partial [Candidatus Falkowbacteria bacterium]|nr:hypothetical protein [Candidatus Falkowbacteria bacterium]